MGLWQPVLVMESGACSLDNISYEGLPTDMCRSYMFQVGGGGLPAIYKRGFCRGTAGAPEELKLLAPLQNLNG